MTTTEAQLYEQIGRLSTAFSALEESVMLLLRALLDASEIVSATLIEDMTFSRLIKLCRLIAKVRFGAGASTYLDLAKGLDKMRARRNLFVHGSWHLMPEHAAAAVWSSRLVGGLDADGDMQGLTEGLTYRSKDEDFTIDTMKKLVREVNALVEEVQAAEKLSASVCWPEPLDD